MDSVILSNLYGAYVDSVNSGIAKHPTDIRKIPGNTRIGPLSWSGTVDFDTTTDQTVIDFTDGTSSGIAARVGPASSFPAEASNEFAGIISGISIALLPGPNDAAGIADLMASFAFQLGSDSNSFQPYNPQAGVFVPRGVGGAFNTNTAVEGYGWAGPEGDYSRVFFIPGGAPLVNFKTGRCRLACKTDNTRTGLTADVKLIATLHGVFVSGSVPNATLWDPCKCSLVDASGNEVPHSDYQNPDDKARARYQGMRQS